MRTRACRVATHSGFHIVGALPAFKLAQQDDPIPQIEPSVNVMTVVFPAVSGAPVCHACH